MTRKEFATLRTGDKVEFIKSDKLNGKIVTISRISGDEIIAPNPLLDGKLCRWKYTHFVKAEKDKEMPVCVAKLRIMTRKSIIGFGKFADMRIGDILKVEPKWLIWAYGKYENITFTDDILEELCCRTIEKPGKDENIVREWLAAKLDEMTPDERKLFWIKHSRGEKKSRIAKAIAANFNEGKLHNRGYLQAANHGHIKL